MTATGLESKLLPSDRSVPSESPRCIQMRALPERPFSFRKLRRTGTRGAELVEMAFVLPILLSLLIGTFWAARAYNIYETITRAAREGARTAVVRSCSVCGNAAQSVSTVENAVLDSLTASSIDTTKVKIPASCSGNLSSKICYQRDLPLNAGTPQEFGVGVGLTYPFKFSLPFTSVNLTTVNIPTMVQMREEN
jgi:Flp pilus assembly protein TadG